MKIKHIIIALLFINSVCSQNYDLGEVTVEELKEQFHPIDSSAEAAYKFKVADTYYELNGNGNWIVVTNVKVKIKIYKKEGLGKANKEVSYYVGGKTSERLSFDDAYTYNLVDNKIERTKLKSEGEFKVDVNEDWQQKKIVLPAVKVGSVIEYSYKLRSPYLTRINDWYFQEDIPIDFVRYAINIPEYFRYRTVITGYEEVASKKEPFSTFDFGGVRNIYFKENMPAIKEESFVNNIKNYTAVLKYELASISYPNQPVQNLSLDWDGVTKQIYKSFNFGRELKFNSYFKDDLDPLLKTVNTRDEKIELILNFVKDRMTFNDKHRVFCEDGVKKAYKNRVGSSAEINLMLVAMLRYADINANPVLVSTKSNGIAFFPNRTAFNYVVAVVEIPDDTILLDATNDNSYLNILPVKALNWKGRIIRKSGSSAEVSLIPIKASNDIVDIIATIDDQGVIEGKLREQSFDYVAFLFREKNKSLKNNSDFIEKLENKYKSVKISDYDISGLKELSQPIIEKYSFQSDDLTDKIGGKLYFSPLLYFERNENPLKQEKRKYPLDYDIPFTDSFRISLNIPTDYEVESVPEAISLIMQTGEASFIFNTKVFNNTIQISSIFSINKAFIPAEQYEYLKELYKIMIEKQSEKIVLRKKV